MREIFRYFLWHEATARPNNLARQYAEQFRINFRVGALWTAVALLAILVIAGALIKVFKPELFKKFIYGWLGVFLVYAVTISILAIVADARVTATLTSYETASWFSIFLWAFLGVAAAVGIILFFVLKSQKNNLKYNENLALSYAAVAIAMSFALAEVRLFRLPQGGSITFASLLPLAIFSYIFGIKRGLLVALTFGMLRAISDPWILHPIQFILDYPLAFAFIGLAGFLKEIKWKGKKLAAYITLPAGIFIVYWGIYLSR